MNRARKDRLRENLDRLDVNEHAQVFQIIKKYTDKYTKTETGVLVSSETLPDTCLLEMETLVTFYLDQHSQMDADEVKRNLVKNGQT
jgi:hypothetical protein|uniref:NET domain-containing protein n=1 Tax=viral metagenome TaxID=1070528 RepID=A0A6C0M2V9_9ZZZZ